MNITKNFTLAEAVVTHTGLNNVIPNEIVMNNIQQLAIHVLQPLRDWYGKPIKVNSWYRTPQVNVAVGGSTTSYHLTGKAADIDTDSVAENKKLFNYIKDNLLFDELIWEFGGKWVHVAYSADKPNRQRIKVAKRRKNGEIYYEQVLSI